MNSPSSLGSNVEGTMQYTPGGNLKRQLTSRRLIKVGDRATDALYLKKLRSSGFGRLSGSFSCNRDKQIGAVSIVADNWWQTEIEWA
jgi:hypothetical protein